MFNTQILIVSKRWTKLFQNREEEKTNTWNIHIYEINNGRDLRELYIFSLSIFVVC